MRNGWVVPPLRRLTSMAWASQASPWRTVTKSIGETARGRPPARGASPIRWASSRDEPGVRRVRREAAPEVGLAARARRGPGRASRAPRPPRGGSPASARSGCAARHRRPAPRRCRPAPRAWRGRRRRRSGVSSSSMPCHAALDGIRLVAAPRAPAGPARSTTALPGTGHPLVELDHRRRGRPAVRRAGRPATVTRSSRRVQVLDPRGVAHPGAREEPAAPGLGAEREEPGVGAVHRDAEHDGEVALERSSCCRG